MSLKILLSIPIILGILSSCQSDDSKSETTPKGKIQRINVLDFGAIPNDDKNDAAGLRAALAACKGNKAKVLYFPEGQYILADDKAIELQTAVFSGGYDSDVQEPLFNRHYDYVKGLDFQGIHNLTVEANGAEILCDGWMEPISLVETENIVINGLSIDYNRPPNSAGKIINMGAGFVDVEFFDWCPVHDSMLFPRIKIYNDEEGLFVNGALSENRGHLIAPQTLRFQSDNPNIEPGFIFWSIHSFHFRPAILLYKALNTTLNDVSIFAQPGMGIVGHLSENIWMNRLKIVPKTSNRYISCNTDATHFATNYGQIVFTDCDFGGQGDDATNVHNYYLVITDLTPDKTCTFLPPLEDLHSQKPDVPRPGDTLAIVNRETLEEIGQIRVQEVVSVNPETFAVTLSYQGQFDQNKDEILLANISALPSLVFKNSRVRAHRARSILCKTRHVLIEGNSFDGSTGTAIHIGAEGNWMEGVASEDVIIRNNTFTRNGGGAGTIDQTACIAIQVEAQRKDVPGLHKRILIENNIFLEPRARYIITVSGAEDVSIRNNIFSNYTGEVFQVHYSDRVLIYDNQSKSGTLNIQN